MIELFTAFTDHALRYDLGQQVSGHSLDFFSAFFSVPTSVPASVPASVPVLLPVSLLAVAAPPAALLPPPWPDPFLWFTLFLTACGLDLAIGGRYGLGRLPGPDRLFSLLAARAGKKLNRAHRSPIALVGRSILLLLIFLPLLSFAGHMLDRLAYKGTAAFFLLALILALIIGQKLVFQMVSGLLKTMRDPRYEGDKSKAQAARWCIERLTLRFADGLIANCLVFLLGGFTFLLPYRFLSQIMAQAAPRGLEGPHDAFHHLPRALYTFLAWVPAWTARLILLGASPALPDFKRAPAETKKTTADTRQSSPSQTSRLMPSRLLPVGMTYQLLGLSLLLATEQKEDPAQDNNRASHVPPSDVPPSDVPPSGASPGAPEVKNILTLLTAAYWLALLLLSAATGLILFVR